MAAKLIKIDKNGSKHYEGMIPCDRCGGQGGSEAWKYTGFTCYKCGGSGQVFAKWIERTPEYEAKLAEKRKAKAAARMAEDAERLEQIRLAQELHKKQQEAEEARIKAQKAISQFIGTVSEKITTSATFDHTAWFDFKMGWKEQRMYIHTFKDPDGNVLVWKTSSNGLGSLNEGDLVQITGTVKEHSTYKDEKQTILHRCKIIKE